MYMPFVISPLDVPTPRFCGGVYAVPSSRWLAFQLFQLSKYFLDSGPRCGSKISDNSPSLAMFSRKQVQAALPARFAECGSLVMHCSTYRSSASHVAGAISVKCPFIYALNSEKTPCTVNEPSSPRNRLSRHASLKPGMNSFKLASRSSGVGCRFSIMKSCVIVLGQHSDIHQNIQFQTMITEKSASVLVQKSS